MVEPPAPPLAVVAGGTCGKQAASRAPAAKSDA
jgi:hypothetical protein